MISAARTDTPGFFTACNVACAGPCACGEAVRAEMEGGMVPETPVMARRSDCRAGVDPNASDVISGAQIGAQRFQGDE